MDKLHIGIMGCRGIPNHYGGFEQFAEQLSVDLVQKGHQVVVYNSNRHPYKKNEWREVKIVHCFDPENRIGTTGQLIYDLNCINDARKRKFDILLHLGYTSDSFWHWRWPQQAINLVNMDGMEWKRSKYNRFIRKFLKWAESLAARKAKLLIADSLGMKDYLFQQYQKKSAYIPYSACPFNNADSNCLIKYGLSPQLYALVIARMEPENNIEMIIKGYIAASRQFPLVIIGNVQNKFGKYLVSRYQSSAILFMGPIYNQVELDNLRYYCAIYFHGHSVGGTNPSLLEAMACHCFIAAHQNIFNTTVLQTDALYFKNSGDITTILKNPIDTTTKIRWKEKNLDKIKTVYSRQQICDAYESLMYKAINEV